MHLVPKRSLHYDRDGRPMGLDEWVVRFEDMEYKRVALTSVGPFNVSTVWLGTDHNWSGEGPPIIFETMVFCGDDRASRTWEDYQVHYCTEAEALEGHEHAVRHFAELGGPSG